MNKFFSIVVLIVLCSVQMLAHAQSSSSPSVPSALAATVVSSSQINLTWTASTDTTGITGYYIYRQGTLVGRSATAFYTDIGLTPSTSYTYTVSAYDAAGNNSAQSSSIIATTQEQGPVLPFDLQTSLDFFTYYSTGVPMKDLMFQASGWQAQPAVYNGTCSPQPQTDPDGYPLALDPSCLMNDYDVLHMSPPPGVVAYPTGHYVLTYQGNGTIKLYWDAVNQKNISPGRIEFDVLTTSSGGIRLNITATDPTNHLHGVHIFLASDETTYQAQPFQQAFLNALAPFKILRMIDWGATDSNVVADNGKAYWTSGMTQIDATHIQLPSTASSVDGAYNNMVALADIGGSWPRLWISGYGTYNGIPNVLTFAVAKPLAVPIGAVSSLTIYQFPNQDWSQRAPTDVLQQQGTRGMAYEYMIQLANTIGKDLWINVPTAASDDFVTQLATFLKNNLNPNLKIYIEYSNETWNYAYPGYNYSEAKYRQLGAMGSSVWVPADEWQAYRVVQIFHLFNQVFGDQDLRVNRPSNDRLVRIITGQTGWTARYLGVIDWENTGTSAPTYGHHASEYADAMAVTDYWTFPSTITGVDPLTLSIAQLDDYQKQAIDEQVASTNSNGANYLYLLAQAAQARGLKLIQYEGQEGFTVTPCNTVADTTCTADKVNHLTAMNRDEGMRGVYDESLKAWNQLSQEFPGVLGDWSQFDDIGTYSQYGFWGMLESVFQDPTTVPRYQGILDYTSGALTGTSVVNYGLNVNISGNGTVSTSLNGVATVQSKFPSGSVVALKATPLAGYQFNGWSGDLTETTNPAPVTVSKNMNVTANFIQTPTITIKTINSKLGMHSIDNRVAYTITAIAPASMNTGNHVNSNAAIHQIAMPTEIIQLQQPAVFNDVSDPQDSDNTLDDDIYKNSIE